MMKMVFPETLVLNIQEPCSPQTPQPFALNVLCPPTTEVGGNGRRSAKQDGCANGHAHGHADVEHSHWSKIKTFLRWDYWFHSSPHDHVG